MNVNIFHPNLNRGGGADLVAANIIQASLLKFDVTLFTLKRPDINQVNRDANTNIDINDIEIRIIRVPSLVPKPLHRPLFARLARWYCDKREVNISTSGRADLCCNNSIQYIHSLKYVDIESIKKYYPDKYRRYNISRIHKALYYIKKMVSPNKTRTACNTTLANSRWTKRVYEKVCGSTAKVLYPPALVDEGFSVEWSERNDNILCVGSICPPKRQLSAIGIFKKTKDKCGYPNKMKVIGKKKESEYSKKVMQAIKNRNDIEYLGRVSRQELVCEMRKNKYGIHRKNKEHFGMSVAEMVHSGMVVFVPNQGGQTEIVENNSDLVFDTDATAVEKISAIVTNQEKQLKIRKELAERQIFDQSRFIKEIQHILEKTEVSEE